MRLNIGCGPLSLAGELGVDREPVRGVEVRADVLALPFRNGCAEFIRADHILEHLTGRQAGPALRELHRVLAPGGTVRVGVPDFLATCRAYLEAESGGDRARILRWVYGSQDHPGEHHQSGWDAERLANALRFVGFSAVEVHPDVDRDEGICIYAEAMKGRWAIPARLGVIL